MIIVLTGPTGSGKSDLAIALAKRLNGAIINADAFQVYQELNIATAKPTPKQREEVPHFLFDFVPLDRDYDAPSYQKDARRTIKELESRYPYLIIAGGTGLYIRSALYDYEFVPESHVDMSPYLSLSEEDLFEELRRIDPESSKVIHPHNRRRVLRAIEIYLSSGKKKSDIEKEQTHAPIFDVKFFGLKKERDAVYETCDKRIDKMLEMGLLSENKALYEKYGTSPHAFQAIGVKETFPYFEGKETLEQCVNLIKKNTRNYVKRQMTFFSHQFELTWVEDEEDILKAIL